MLRLRVASLVRTAKQGSFSHRSGNFPDICERRKFPPRRRNFRVYDRAIDRALLCPKLILESNASLTDRNLAFSTRLGLLKICKKNARRDLI